MDCEIFEFWNKLARNYLSAQCLSIADDFRNDHYFHMTQYDAPSVDPAITAMWHEILTKGHKHRASSLPGGNRCGMCMVPMSGFGGAVVKTFSGITPSPKNPSMCNL
ncbi:MAG: hypothetical protein HQ477_00570 [Chloroflexi bacterium]|nr:hypothetical protein [Chloroflexota bacterium]